MSFMSDDDISGSLQHCVRDDASHSIVPSRTGLLRVPSARVRYTRDEFERVRKNAKRVERREGWLLAAISMSLGLGQLVAIAWMDRHLERPLRLALESGLFLAYLALVVALLWRMQRRIRRARPTCPSCRAAMSELSERVPVATGRCDSCGRDVLLDTPRTVELPISP
jgi:hypothetical protein